LGTWYREEPAGVIIINRLTWVENIVGLIVVLYIPEYAQKLGPIRPTTIRIENWVENTQIATRGIPMAYDST
jgi:hypothetical protein